MSLTGAELMINVLPESLLSLFSLLTLLLLLSLQ
jgi:hypothetical protein